MTTAQALTIFATAWTGGFLLGLSARLNPKRKITPTRYIRLDGKWREVENQNLYRPEHRSAK